jgi:DNA-binding response OmpR family regulator
MARQGRRLLVVQRNHFVAKSLARYLGDDFDAVDIASDIESAEAILADPFRTPTHVVCGQNFGPGSVSGTDTIPRWRQTYEHVERVVLATSEIDVSAAPNGVDALFIKPASPAALRAILVDC